MKKSDLSNRIHSIDILRGLVMVVMALDHTRDYFHEGAMLSDPTNLETTTPFLFMTRFVTHFCAPVFIFLTGTSANLFGQSRSKNELSKFLWSRGLWLIFVEIAIMNFLWWFNPNFAFINLQVIWVIGLCMIAMSLLIYLPTFWLLGAGLMIIFLHNLLDPIRFQGGSLPEIAWYILHQQQFVQLSPSRTIAFFYPFLPWIGVMMCGYSFGFLYRRNADAAKRRKVLLLLGISAITIFLLLRAINTYGDIYRWSVQKNAVFTFMSFINVTKYPPSLLYVLITIGPTFIVLYFLETFKNRLTGLLLVFGRVPFFYYVLHVFVLHSAALLTLWVLGDDWTLMILTMESFTSDRMVGYGYSLSVVYLVWLLAVVFLFPFCFKYMRYKLNNRDKWWLSYL